MDFDQQKKFTLEKTDKSKKGSIDKKIKKLVNLINRKKDFYTTSSCSGRVVLIEVGKNQKLDARWLFVSHDSVTLDQVQIALKQKFNHKLWFKFESSILHVACRTLENASILQQMVFSTGMKRSGIIAAKKRFIVEIIGTEGIESLIGVDGKLLVTAPLITELVQEANRKMERNHEKLLKLFGFIKTIK